MRRRQRNSASVALSQSRVDRPDWSNGPLSLGLPPTVFSFEVSLRVPGVGSLGAKKLVVIVYEPPELLLLVPFSNSRSQSNRLARFSPLSWLSAPSLTSNCDILLLSYEQPISQNKRYVVRNGMPQLIPSNPVALIKSNILSTQLKLPVDKISSMTHTFHRRSS
ncbi:hypothetical protein KFK09_014050 [Dendrobium nobile]|uniref:Uncharacterized protein n=1 Tax=Dendrobium nobile TaxID=94219 RepID=A0A8T3BBG1_DENNO|nr:hypothetical protein KFK09_014050 [Dendrobium nobile]